MSDYKIEDVNKITQMLKDIAAMKTDHPAMGYLLDDATQALVDSREYIMGILKQ